MDERNAKAIGARIKTAIEASGLDRAEVSQQVGWTGVSMLSRVVNGESSTRPDKLQRLAQVLNVRVDWLLTGEGEMSAPRDTNANQMTLDQFLAVYSADLTGREVEYLRGLNARTEHGTASASVWMAVALARRDESRPLLGGVGGSGGGKPSPTK